MGIVTNAVKIHRAVVVGVCTVEINFILISQGKGWLMDENT